MRLNPPAAPRRDGASTASAEKPTAYRAVGGLIGGAFLTVCGLFGAVAFAFGSEKHSLAAAIAFALAVFGFVGGVYPAAFSYTDRLVIRNPFRYIVVAWPRVAEVTARLSLVVEVEPESSPTDGSVSTSTSVGDGGSKPLKFTVWSVPVSMRDRRKVDRQQARTIRAVRTDALRTAKSQSNAEALLHGGRGSGSMRGRQGVDVIENMAFADQAVREMKDRKNVCSTPAEEAGATVVMWTWWTLLPAVLAVVLIVAAAAGAFGK